MKRIAILAAGFAALAGSSAWAVTIYPGNDGFELGNLGSGPGAYAYGFGQSWTFVGGAGEAANGSAFNVIGAPNGNMNGGATSAAGQAAFIQGGDGTLAGSSVSQSVTLPAGNATLHFSDEWRTFNQGPNGIVLFLDGVAITGIIVPPSDTTFTPYAMNIGTVTAGPHVIGFAGDNYRGGDSTSFVDSVSITVTPEPASLGFLGLAATGMLARRRRA